MSKSNAGPSHLDAAELEIVQTLVKEIQQERKEQAVSVAGPLRSS
jgi:hypothetical protein